MLDKIRDIINSDNVTRMAKALSEPHKEARDGLVEATQIILKGLDNAQKTDLDMMEQIQCLTEVMASFSQSQVEILATMEKITYDMQTLHVQVDFIKANAARDTNVVTTESTFDDFWAELESVIQLKCRHWTKLRLPTVIGEVFRREHINTLELVNAVLHTRLPRIGPMSKSLIKEALINIGAYHE